MKTAREHGAFASIYKTESKNIRGLSHKDHTEVLHA